MIMFFMRHICTKINIPNRNNVLKKYLIIRRYNDVCFDDIPDVSPTVIKKAFKRNKVNYEEGFTCFITACPLCYKSKSTNNVYINKITGVFMCPSCKSNGQWDVLEGALEQKKYTDLENKVNCIVEKDKITQYLEEVDSHTKEMKHFLAESHADIWESFNLPVVSDKVLDSLNIRIDESCSKLYFPLENANSELVGYNVLNKSNLQTIEPTLTCGGVLIYNSSKLKSNALLVPNISDFLILLDSNIPGTIVCMPNKLINLSQYVLPCFEKFDKLILWFGNDVQSWDKGRTFAKKLDEKRCLFIRPTEKHPLPHIEPNQDFKNIVSSAQPIWHKSITTFASLREDVLSDLQNIDKDQGIKWKRYPTLNKILKGHRRGELTVITGPTGSGKTTFISEYSLDLAMQGVNTLWGSFEIRNARLARTMLQQMSGIPLDENLDKFDFWADQFEQLPIYFMTFHGQQVIKVVMEAVEHATYVHDISHIIIDNVQFMMGMTDEPKHMDRFWKQDVIVASFRNFATKKNCHVTLVIHPRKEKQDEDLTTSSIFGGAKASQEADNVLLIQDKRLTTLRGKKVLQIAKNRYSGDLGIMPLEFDKTSLSYSQKKKKTTEGKKINGC